MISALLDLHLAGPALTFGDAGFFGDMSNVALAGPILDSIPTPSGRGYYMVGSDGGIFDFSGTLGAFKGSLGGAPPARPITSVAVLERD